MSKYIVHKAVELGKVKKSVKLDIDTDYILQPKWDGVHALFVLDPADPKVLSRTNERILSCDHILNGLLDIEELHGHTVISELWAGNLAFSAISGAARRHSPSTGLLAVCYDCVDFTDWEEPHTDLAEYGVRFNRLIDAGPNRQLGEVGVVTNFYGIGTFGGLAGAGVIAKTYVNAGGFDGAIIRDWYAPYFSHDGGTNGEIIKVKPVQSESFPIRAVKVAIGAKTGRVVVTFAVETAPDVLVEVSGADHATQLHASKYPELYTGKIAEVEFMARYTSGSLREPRFKGIRADV